MKILSTLILITVLAGSLKSQTVEESDSVCSKFTVHSEYDKSISFSVNQVMNNPYHSVFVGGFKTRIFLSKRISADSELLIGKDYIQFGMGIFIIPFLLIPGLETSLFPMLICPFMLVALEHLAYHFPIKNFIDISPYISALRCKLLKTNNEEIPFYNDDLPPAFAVGVELNKYFGKFFISPYAEYSMTYDGKVKGFTLGLNAGYYFKYRK